MTDKNKEKNKISKDYFNDFLSFLPVAICFVNSEGYILNVNEKAEKILDYKKHELIDSEMNKIFKKKDVESILSRDIRAEEIEVKSKEGEKPVSLFSGKRVGDDKSHIFVALSDLSRAKKIEKEVEEKVKELERFNRLATGRELRMVELKRDKKKLKQEVEEMEDKLKKIEEKKDKENDEQREK